MNVVGFNMDPDMMLKSDQNLSFQISLCAYFLSLKLHKEILECKYKLECLALDGHGSEIY